MGGGAVTNLVEGGLEVGWDKALSPHGSDGSWYASVVPLCTTPLQDALKRVVGVCLSKAAELHPLRSDVLHWVAEFAFVSEPSEAAVGALPPFTNWFSAFKAIKTSKWS